MSKLYMLLQPDEDGNPVRLLHEKDLDRLLADPRGEYGVGTFMNAFPKDMDTNYWPEGSALLLEVKLLKTKTVTTAFAVDE